MEQISISGTGPLSQGAGRVTCCFSNLNLETIINQPEPSGLVNFGANLLMRTWMKPVVF